MKKQIEGYDNYFIYDNGDVYNSQTQKILKGSISEHGYKYYRLSKDNHKKMYYAHRLVAENFIPNPKNLPVVNHIDGNKTNNNTDNLEWTSYFENIQKWHQLIKDKKHQKNEKYIEDLPNEEWKPIPNQNYMVSSLGRIRNLKTNNILHPSFTCGYDKVRLSKEGKTTDVLVHHLVYQVFNNDFDNNENYVIDHIDGNKRNNATSNLRKIPLSENVLSALYQTKTNKTGKTVSQYTLDGKYVATYPSAAMAARVLSLDSSTITKVCRGVNKTHGGFIFKYE